MGVVVIEKHFNLDNKKTPDSKFSIGPKMMKDLKKISLEIFESIYKTRREKVLMKNIKFRRSIFAKTNIKKHEKISQKNISVLRPKIGICASQCFKILGKKSKKNFKIDEPIFKNQLL